MNNVASYNAKAFQNNEAFWNCYYSINITSTHLDAPPVLVFTHVRVNKYATVLIVYFMQEAGERSAQEQNTREAYWLHCVWELPMQTLGSREKFSKVCLY